MNVSGFPLTWLEGFGPVQPNASSIGLKGGRVGHVTPCLCGDWFKVRVKVQDQLIELFDWLINIQSSVANSSSLSVSDCVSGKPLSGNEGLLAPFLELQLLSVFQSVWWSVHVRCGLLLLLYPYMCMISRRYWSVWECVWGIHVSKYGKRSFILTIIWLDRVLTFTWRQPRHFLWRQYVFRVWNSSIRAMMSLSSSIISVSRSMNIVSTHLNDWNDQM